VSGLPMLTLALTGRCSPATGSVRRISGVIETAVGGKIAGQVFKATPVDLVVRLPEPSAEYRRNPGDPDPAPT